MDKKKTAVRAVAVLAVALAAGHLAQTINESRQADRAAEKAASAEKPKAVETVSAGPASAAPAADPALPAAAALVVTDPASAATETASPAAAPAEAALVPPVLATLPGVPSFAPEPATPSIPIKEVDPGDLAAPAPELAALVPSDTGSADLPLPQAPAAAAPATPGMAADDCPVTLTLTPGQRAMISVALAAPCRAGQRIVLRHAGLAIAEKLDETGTLTLDLPALDSRGEVSVLLSDAKVLRDAAPVPEAGLVHRFAVQWMADDSFQLYAFENGADYGQPGAVSAEAPVSAGGGYLVALGDPTLALPMMAQIYTWPADPGLAVDLTVESVVTDATCGRELIGETIESQAGKAALTDLTLAMPECDAVGDILVLKNPGRDVTLAVAN
ncbi:MAG: hypothetical protein R3D63_15950 [Paracoccaceae bacterium]